MKKLTKFGCMALLAICVTPLTFAGCGGSDGSKVIEPEMSAEEIQAKADSKADEVVDPT
ncbi:hypothetical protein [Aporhodopirellula aestuarii]|uniref:Secreted protein n=1 Tax=Aporhodopirellula aestuarii TaxID=2950107 RepID=A0ABT0UDV9_9BACT|nr:hypothetical protein [Aporhodopirellula aestuarii]MCM2375105.1 hypothetical protein [Aporhodopirellula aestuarii]